MNLSFSYQLGCAVAMQKRAGAVARALSSARAGVPSLRRMLSRLIREQGRMTRQLRPGAAARGSMTRGLQQLSKRTVSQTPELRKLLTVAPMQPMLSRILSATGAGV